MSDFSQMIEEYATKDEFPSVGNPEITYRSLTEGLDYEWIQIDTDGAGVYELRNPQIREYRDTEELPEHGVEGVLYVIHDGSSGRRFLRWFKGRSPIDTGWVPTTEEDFFNLYPCPGRVTAYLQEEDRVPMEMSFTEFSELPELGDVNTTYLRQPSGEEWIWCHERHMYMKKSNWVIERMAASPHAPPVRSPRSPHKPAGSEEVVDYILDQQRPAAHTHSLVDLLDQQADAGQRAREKLQKRGAWYRIKRFFLWLLAIVLLAIGGIGYFGYTQWQNRVVEWRTDFHKCYAKLGNTVIEGQRSYRYKATTIMGYRYLSHDTVTETTSLRRSGLAFRVVGVVDEIPWTHSNESNQGKEFVEMLPTDRYTFISANDINVVTYDDFCNTTKPIEE